MISTTPSPIPARSALAGPGTGELTAPVGELRASRPDADQFLLDAYRGVVVSPGKGVPHAHAVATILRENGSDQVTQLAGLLHDVVEDTPRTVDDVRANFGHAVAEMVAVLTEDPWIRNPLARKRLLRSRIAAAGSPVVDVALADKIATLRFALLAGQALSRPKLIHYRSTLQLALLAGVGDELCTQVADLLRRIGDRAAAREVASVGAAP